MRILVFSQHFWPESFRINDVVRHLHAAGHEVQVLTGQPNYPDGDVFAGYRAGGSAREDWQGISIHRVPLIPRGSASARRLILNYLSFIGTSVVWGLWRLRGRRFDVVLVYATSPLLQAIGAWVIARLKGAALVTWVQDLWPQSLQVTGYFKEGRPLAIVEWWVRWIYARQDLVLIPSRAFEAPVRALAPAATAIAYLPNAGDDEDRALPSAPAAPARAALTLAPGFNIVFAGNLGTAQALETVLDAAALLADEPAIRFVLIGSGQRSAWLHEQVRMRELRNVQLPGRFAPGQMPALFAQAQALLVTLRRDQALSLTVPSKVQSYLAAGRPILAALDGEGARLVLESGTGIACAAEDAAALAQAARRLHALPVDERERMGRAGRAWHEAHFTPAVLTPRLVAQLEQAVRGLRRQ
jgi:glycosyltransferase involved in cell wall biosynthesis